MAALTPEQAEEVREIAMKIVIAATRAQAGHACGEVIQRYRVSRAEVEEFLSAPAPHPVDVGGPVA